MCEYGKGKWFQDFQLVGQYFSLVISPVELIIKYHNFQGRQNSMVVITSKKYLFFKIDIFYKKF